MMIISSTSGLNSLEFFIAKESVYVVDGTRCHSMHSGHLEGDDRDAEILREMTETVDIAVSAAIIARY